MQAEFINAYVTIQKRYIDELSGKLITAEAQQQVLQLQLTNAQQTIESLTAQIEATKVGKKEKGS